MKLSFYWLTSVVVSIATLLSSWETFAAGCAVSGPRYQLRSDTVGWSMKIGSGASCISGLRLNDVIIGSVQITDPPHFGRVSLPVPGVFSFTARSDFRGQDSFTAVVTGTINGVPGSSTIHIDISVLAAPSTTRPFGGQATAPIGAPGTSNNPAQLLSGASEEFGAQTDYEKLEWSAVKIGAGGFVTGIDIARDGTKVIRCDTYGAYLWNPNALSPGNAGGSGAWEQLVTTHSIALASAGSNYGVYEIVVAPNDANVAYMFINNSIYFTTNLKSGKPVWALTKFPSPSIVADANGHNRTMGRLMAVDPANPNIVIAGTPASGAYFTMGGTTGGAWSQIAAVGKSGNDGGGDPGNQLVVFDPSSNVVDGATQGIYISTYGTGVYHATTGITGTWNLTSGTPTTHQHMVVTSSTTDRSGRNPNGTIWFTDNSGNLWKYSTSGAWGKLISGNTSAVAVDPADGKNITAFGYNMAINFSSNGGSSFGGANNASNNITATDIPWLARNKSLYVSMGDAAYDRSQSNTVLLSTGVGVFSANPPATNNVYTSQSAGIEQLVARWIISPWSASSVPIFTAEDRALWRINNPNVFPSDYGPAYNYAIIAGWSCDWAGGSPTTIACVADFSGVGFQDAYSSDGGASWNLFSGHPSQVTNGGVMAVADANHFLWINDSTNGDPYITSNKGASWTGLGSYFNTNFSTGAYPSHTGWGSVGGFYTLNESACGDKVNAGTYYMYNNGNGTALSRYFSEGIYVSTDYGSTWKKFAHGVLNASGTPSFGGQMRCNPLRAGYLCFTPGVQLGASHPTTSVMRCSTNGGQTWSDISNGLYTVRDVWSFDYGAPKPGGNGNPAIYIYGWVNGVGGIWASDDDATTWTQLSGLQINNSWDSITVVGADANIYRRIYVGFGGSGFAFGKLIPR